MAARERRIPLAQCCSCAYKTGLTTASEGVHGTPSIHINEINFELGSL